MICESGRVVEVEPGWVIVETIRTSACKSCSAKAGCGQGLLNSMSSGKRSWIRVSTKDFSELINVDDEVELVLPERVMLTGSFWVYLMPLLFLLAGAVLGSYGAVPADKETSAIIGSGLGFVIACLVLRWHAYIHRCNPEYQPRLQRISKTHDSNSVLSV